MAGKINRQWILAERPPAEPQISNFKLVEQPIPQPGDGEPGISADAARDQISAATVTFLQRVAQ